HQRLDLGERRARSGREHQFLGFVERDAGQAGQIEAQVGLARSAERALRPRPPHPARPALLEGPARGPPDLLTLSRLPAVRHAHVLSAPSADATPWRAQDRPHVNNTSDHNGRPLTCKEGAMGSDLVQQDRPVSNQFHPGVYFAFVGLALWLALAVWG